MQPRDLGRCPRDQHCSNRGRSSVSFDTGRRLLMGLGLGFASNDGMPRSGLDSKSHVVIESVAFVRRNPRL